MSQCPFLNPLYKSIITQESLSIPLDKRMESESFNNMGLGTHMLPYGYVNLFRKLCA